MRSKLVRGAVGGPEFPKQPDDAARHFRRHGRTASHGLPQGFQQACRRRFLEQVAGSPRAQRLKNPIIIFVHGQHQDRQAGMTLLENPYAFDPAHAGKLGVIGSVLICVYVWLLCRRSPKTFYLLVVPVIVNGFSLILPSMPFFYIALGALSVVKDSRTEVPAKRNMLPRLLTAPLWRLPSTSADSLRAS